MDPKILRNSIQVELSGGYHALGQHKQSWTVYDQEGTCIFSFPGLDLRKPTELALLNLVVGTYNTGFARGVKAGEEVKAQQIRAVLGIYLTKDRE